MNDIATMFLIGGELAFLAFAIRWLAKELKQWKTRN